MAKHHDLSKRILRLPKSRLVVEAPRKPDAELLDVFRMIEDGAETASDTPGSSRRSISRARFSPGGGEPRTELFGADVNERRQPNNIPFHRSMGAEFDGSVRAMINGMSPLDRVEYESREQWGREPEIVLPTEDENGYRSGRIGAISGRYESNDDPGAVSSGRGDRGGVSYGRWQLATNEDQPEEFLNAEGSGFAANFAGVQPGSPEFGAAWRQTAAEDPEGFEQAQFDYIRRTHYEPIVNGLWENDGIDVGALPDAAQDAIWSTAVQHGDTNGAAILDRVIGNISEPVGTPEWEEAFIGGIYDERGRPSANGGAAYFPGSSPAVQRSVRNRFRNEKSDALDMLEAQRQNRGWND